MLSFLISFSSPKSEYNRGPGQGENCTSGTMSGVLAQLRRWLSPHRRFSVISIKGYPSMLTISDRQMKALKAVQVDRHKNQIFRAVNEHFSITRSAFDAIFEEAWSLGFKDHDALIDVLTAASLAQHLYADFFSAEMIQRELSATEHFPQRIRAKRLRNLVEVDD